MDIEEYLKNFISLIEEDIMQQDMRKVYLEKSEVFQ